MSEVFHVRGVYRPEHRSTTISAAVDPEVGSKESVSNRLERSKSKPTAELATKGIARRKRHIPELSGGAIATYQVQLTRKTKIMESRKNRPKTLDKVDLMRRPDGWSIKPTAKRRRDKLNEKRRKCKLKERRRRSNRRRRERLQPSVCAYNSRQSE